MKGFDFYGGSHILFFFFFGLSEFFKLINLFFLEA